MLAQLCSGAVGHHCCHQGCHCSARSLGHCVSCSRKFIAVQMQERCTHLNHNRRCMQIRNSCGRLHGAGMAHTETGMLAR